VGHIDDTLLERLSGLSVEELDALGEALLDFSSMADLTNCRTYALYKRAMLCINVNTLFQAFLNYPFLVAISGA